jgi:hypothetical protein
MKPERIQRKRTKDWKMPPNTVYVGRPTKWGNPIRVLGGDCIYIDRGHSRKILDKWVFYTIGDIEDTVYLYWLLWQHDIKHSNQDMQYWSDKFKQLDLSELKGKNLACWCPLDQPCHADILLELANK